MCVEGDKDLECSCPLLIPSVPESDARPDCGETAMCVEGDKNLECSCPSPTGLNLNQLPLPLPPVN